MIDRNTDILKQGFMKIGKPRRAKGKTFDETEWARRNVQAAKARYASYGPDFFRD